MNQRNEPQGVDQERGDETPAGGEDQVLPDGGRRRSFFFRLQRTAHRKFPDVVPGPELGERLAGWRKRDAESNSKSAPPPDEVIDLRCVWAVEVYTPSQIGALLRGFEKLGWDTGDPLSANRNPALWIQHNRESASGGGWMNLGFIRRPGASEFVGHTREAPLPAGVDYALAGLYSRQGKSVLTVRPDPTGLCWASSPVRPWFKACLRCPVSLAEVPERGFIA